MQRELGHLVAVAEKGSVTRAAAALGITQSALTKSLQRLESYLGLTLVERSAHGSNLTPEGETILARARSVEAEMRYLELEAANFRNRSARQLKFGASPSWGSSIVPGIVRKIREQHPDIELTIVTDLEGRLIELLKEGSIDFALCGTVPSPPQHGITFQPVSELDVLVACRRKHPLFGRWNGNREELFRQDWIDYRSALERPRRDSPPLSRSIKGEVIRTQSWFLISLIAAKNDVLVTLPEQLGDYISVFDLDYLSDDYRVSTIAAGLWSRTSFAETKIGRSFQALAKSEMSKNMPVSRGARRYL